MTDQPTASETNIEPIPFFVFMALWLPGVLAVWVWQLPELTIAFGFLIGLALAGVLAFLEDKKTDEPSGDLIEKYHLYLDGKMKRFNLLFAVNGGLFAIIQIADKGGKYLIGRLSIGYLAIGGILFTAVMAYDIFGWGAEMRHSEMLGNKAFTWKGKIITLLISGLIMSGWSFVALPVN